ncbi:MAG: 4Fe-4S binding protein, partial [Pseudomonadota bacterium]
HHTCRDPRRHCCHHARSPRSGTSSRRCDGCGDCIPVCPTGSIDNWRVVETP